MRMKMVEMVVYLNKENFRILLEAADKICDWTQELDRHETSCLLNNTVDLVVQQKRKIYVALKSGGNVEEYTWQPNAELGRGTGILIKETKCSSWEDNTSLEYLSSLKQEQGHSN